MLFNYMAYQPVKSGGQPNIGRLHIVVFTCPLQEKEMCQRHLQSHLFICPSSIENNPNSPGGALLLGVTFIASYIGGVTDMIAENIVKLFTDRELANKISVNGKAEAFKRHSSAENNITVINI